MARNYFSPQFSSGERSFILAMIGTSILGAVLACVAVLRLSEAAPASQFEIAFTFWTILSGFVGGAVGICSACERWFGFSGVAGWMTASIGALAVTGISAVVAGSLILPFFGTMFAPLQVIIIMIETPVLAVVWFGMMACAQGLLGKWRRERDSIFAS